MHVPTDVSLAAWIRHLDEVERLYRFYKTDEWLDLRDAILKEAHHECTMCRERGIYSRAVTVHHVNEVKARPELALSRMYRDVDGTMKPNLVALCGRCHNIVHKRFCFGQQTGSKQELTEERW